MAMDSLGLSESKEVRAALKVDYSAGLDHLVELSRLDLLLWSLDGKNNDKYSALNILYKSKNL